MAVTTDEIRILLKINGQSSYTTTMNQVTNSTNMFNNSLGKVASTLAKLVSVGAILKFSKDCVKAASDLEEVANVVSVTFGRNASQITEWAKSSAASFGLSQKAAEEYAGKFGTMAKQFGYTLDDATEMSKALTQLTGDISSFYNLNDSEAFTKLKAIFTGETEGLKALGVVMTEANLNAYALSNGYGKLYKQMTEHEKAGLRYSFVMEKLNHAQGDFERTSDSFANTLRTVQLKFEDLKTEVGAELIPVAKYGLELLSVAIQTYGPKIVTVAETIKLYVEAWKTASEETKKFAKMAVVCVAVMLVVPKAITIIRKAIKLLFIDTVTLTTAVNALLGILGIFFALMAFKQLSESVQEMRELGESAETSSDSVEELSDSLQDLGESSKQLDTFLASFDEVNKVGGSSSLMSNVVTTDDIANISEFSDELKGANDLLGDMSTAVGGLDSSMFEGTFLSIDWWKDLTDSLIGFIKELGKPAELLDDFERGLHELGAWFEKELPNWSGYWEYLGEKIYNALHPNEGKKDEGKDDTFIWTDSDSGRQHIMQKHNADGSESDLWKAYKHNTSTTVAYAAGGLPNKGSLFLAGESGAELVGNFGGSQTRVLNQSQYSGGAEQAIYFSPTIQIDGRKISSVVLDNINSMTRSSGRSPLIELGG